MTEYYRFNHTMIALLCISNLLSCASTQENFTLENTPQDYSEIMAIRAKPASMSELEYECICMNDEIEKINTFTARMVKSRFAVLYQALGRDKVSVINDHKNTINCQQFMPDQELKSIPQVNPEVTVLRTKHTDTVKRERECHNMDDEITKLSIFTRGMNRSKFATRYQELSQNIILSINEHKNTLNCQQFEM